MIGAYVTQGVVEGQAKLPVAKNNAAIFIRLAPLPQLGPEKRIAIEKNGRQAHEYPVLLAYLIDGVLDDLEILVGFLGRRRTEGYRLEDVVHCGTEVLVGEVRFLHQLVNGSDRPGDFGVVDDGGGKAAQIPLGLDLVPSLGIVGDLLGKAD